MPRRWARIMIVLGGLGLLALGGMGLVQISWAMGLLLAVFAVCTVWALCIKFLVLRCPHCGWGGGQPQWSRPGKAHCPRCGGLMYYDDDQEGC